MSLSNSNPQIDPGTNAAVNDSRASLESFKTAATNNVTAAANTIRDHPITQNLSNGPVAQSVKAEAAQTSNELGGLANSRQTPQTTTATGQSLTHYHSFFYTLLRWEHPRATAITFASSIAFIFACRYLPVLKWLLKLTYMVLGVVTLAEAGGKAVLGSSVTSSVRPRKYYKIPKETLEASLDDLEQLINFFVIEVQRIVFAENIPATALAFSSAFVSYYLIKILPFWGLALLGTCVVYLAPLVYLQNKELIDGQLEQAGHIINRQTQQVRDITAEHANKGFENIKSYTSDYTSKASGYVGASRQKIPPVSGTSTGSSVGAGAGAGTTTSRPGYKETDFPAAPVSTLPSVGEHSKPVVHAPTDGQPIAASAI